MSLTIWPNHLKMRFEMSTLPYNAKKGHQQKVTPRNCQQKIDPKKLPRSPPVPHWVLPWRLFHLHPHRRGRSVAHHWPSPARGRVGSRCLTSLREGASAVARAQTNVAWKGFYRYITPSKQRPVLSVLIQSSTKLVSKKINMVPIHTPLNILSTGPGSSVNLTKMWKKHDVKIPMILHNH